MRTRERFSLLLVAIVTGAAGVQACSGGGEGGPVGGNYDLEVSGRLVDWRSGAPVGAASIRSVGISPAREAEAASDGTFTMAGIPAFGYVIFDVEAPGYARTLSPTILVEDEDLEDLVVEVLADGDQTLLLGGFGVVTTAGNGHVLGRVLSSSGEGVPGVAAVQVLPVTLEPDGPYFLTSSDQPAPGALATGETGAFVFFNSHAGNIAVQGAAPGQVLSPVASVVKDNAWSLVTLGGRPPKGAGTPTPTATPGPQDFTADIVPILMNRGCVDCHRTGTAPQGFRLDNAQSRYNEITVELSPVTGTRRVDTADPDASLLLTRPTFEDPPDQHPNAIFQTPDDPDYQKIRRWIADGAQQ